MLNLLECFVPASGKNQKIFNTILILSTHNLLIQTLKRQQASIQNQGLQLRRWVRIGSRGKAHVPEYYADGPILLDEH